MHTGSLRCLKDFGIGQAMGIDRDVLAQRAGKEPGVLQHRAALCKWLVGSSSRNRVDTVGQRSASGAFNESPQVVPIRASAPKVAQLPLR